MTTAIITPRDSTITITIVVPNITEVMSVFDRIKVYRSTTGEAGPYLEITTPLTRIALESAKTAYVYTDASGDAGYFYRVSFFHATTQAESLPSLPEQGDGDDALDLISVDELKQIFLFGVELTNDKGEPYPDLMFQHGIRQAVSRLEHELDLPLLPTIIEDEAHDFMAQEWSKFIWLQLARFPVISIEEIRLVLPTEQNVLTFRPEWIRLLDGGASGQVNIVPGVGQIALGSATWIQLIRGGADFLPDVIRVDYTAGFARGRLPATLKEAIGKLAAFGPLNIAGDLVAGPGIASKSNSIDGLSQSITSTKNASSAGYTARLKQYAEELKDLLPMLRRYYKGQRMLVA